MRKNRKNRVLHCTLNLHQKNKKIVILEFVCNKGDGLD